MWQFGFTNNLEPERGPSGSTCDPCRLPVCRASSCSGLECHIEMFLAVMEARLPSDAELSHDPEPKAGVCVSSTEGGGSVRGGRASLKYFHPVPCCRHIYCKWGKPSCYGMKTPDRWDHPPTTQLARDLVTSSPHSMPFTDFCREQKSWPVRWWFLNQNVPQ